MTQDARKAVYIMGVLLLAIFALGPSVATAQKWQVNDRYDGGPVAGRTAEATVLTGEPTTHIARSVALSYGCDVSPQRGRFGGRRQIQDVLLVAREPLRSRGSTGRKTLYGSYGVDGTSIESNSRWTVGGAEGFAYYDGPSLGQLVTHLIQGRNIVIKIAGDSGVQEYRFPLAGSAAAITAARQYCGWR